VTEVAYVYSSVYSAPFGSVVCAGGHFYRKTGDVYIADLPGWEPLQEVWAEHFGAEVEINLTKAESSTFDSAPLVQEAIMYRQDHGGGKVHLGDGYYCLGATLVLSGQEVQLVGNGERSTILFAYHDGGPVLHVMDRSCALERFACISSSVRSSTTSPLNVGIRFQIDDVPNSAQRLKNSVVENVRVIDQPSHGIVISNAFTGTFNRLWVLNNGGHGVVADRGFAYPMTNIEGVPGLCSFNESQVADNRGHGFAFGHPDDDFTTQSLRMTVTNCEISKNATDTTVRYKDAQVYCRSTEVTFTVNVFKPVPASGSSGVYIAGRNIHLVNNRFIDVGHVAIIGSYDIFATVGVYITGFDVISSPLITSAIRVEATEGQTSEPYGIYVNNYNFNGGVQTLVDTGASMGSGGAWRVPGLSIGGTTLSIDKTMDQTISNMSTPVMDDELKFWVAVDEKVRFVCTMEYSGPPGSDFKFMVVTPEGATCRYVPESGSRLNNGNDVVFSGVVDDGGVVSVGSTDATHRIVTFRGFVHNGATPGVVNVAWAQRLEDVGETKVYSGLSCLELTRLLQ
jgi:hypothetical protein